ncbi:MAG: hypothetical protein CVV42_15110 [Candidatus Riflebacteria bacterium HGW-Riflebacteria-2]|jgi:serine/threonine-protein phosphatase 6 regulatory ankyrin repeat subunit B|nr:MAG: hypothetical protein CVV42_15110 [Candidatus Riflebacteria bacterium HGW-Riflebacteria-2]
MKTNLISRKVYFVKLSYAILPLMLLLLCISANSVASDLEKNLNDAITNNRAAEVARVLKSGGAKLKEAIRNNAAHYIRQVSRYGTAEIVRQVLEGCALTGEKQALNHALVEAADNNSFAEVVPLLLVYGADPNHEYNMNYVLNRVVMLYSGKPDKSEQLLTTVRVLLDRGAYIDSFDDSMETPLMTACRNNDLPVVKLLISRGANPGLQNKDTKSAMSYAPAGSAVANELARKSTNAKVAGKGEPALGLPTSPGANLFNMSADELDQHTQNLSFDNYMNDLMQLSAAVSSGDADTVKELLGKGLDADSVVDDSGITMLMQAANLEIAELLLAAGADAGRADAKGWTALHHLATREADEKLAIRLIRAGADIHHRNNDGETPLRATGLLFTENIAPAWGSALITLLVNEGADIDTSDKQGHTLLHQAAFNDNEALAKICIARGGNPDIKTKAGKTPRQIARELKSKNCLKAFSSR